MSYAEVIVSVAPGSPKPEQDHSEQFYCHLEVIKKKGRRKKDDPIDYRLRYVPWSEINDTELLSLVLFGMDFGSREETARWNVVCRGLRRGDLIGMIKGNTDARDLQSNPVHVARDRMSRLLRNNWAYIHSQIKCNTLCWECPDAKALECVLENGDMLRSDSI